jgi:hypothetical protein
VAEQLIYPLFPPPKAPSPEQSAPDSVSPVLNPEI